MAAQVVLVLLGVSLDEPFVFQGLLGRGSVGRIRLDQSFAERFRVIRDLVPEFALAVVKTTSVGLARCGKEIELVRSQSNIGSRALADQIVRLLRLEWKVPAQQEVRDDSTGRVGEASAGENGGERESSLPDGPYVDGKVVFLL